MAGLFPYASLYETDEPACRAGLLPPKVITHTSYAEQNIEPPEIELIEVSDNMSEIFSLKEIKI